LRAPGNFHLFSVDEDGDVLDARAPGLFVGFGVARSRLVGGIDLQVVNGEAQLRDFFVAFFAFFFGFFDRLGELAFELYLGFRAVEPRRPFIRSEVVP